MCNKVKQAALDAAEVLLPIKVPDSLRRALLKTRDILGIVHVPAGCNVMNASNELIQRAFPCEFFDPVFGSGNKIAFTTKAHREVRRPGVLHHFKIDGKLFE